MGYVFKRRTSILLAQLTPPQYRESVTGDANAASSSGGEEVLLDVSGQDATEAFEDVGHSDEAREILDGLLVGKLRRQVGEAFSYRSIDYCPDLLPLSLLLPLFSASKSTLLTYQLL